MSPLLADILIRAASLLLAAAVIGYFVVFWLCVRNAWRASAPEGVFRWAITALFVFLAVPVLIAHGISALAS